MGNEDKAPFCPVSYDQDAENPRGVFGVRGTAPIRLPVIPLATDLPSLVRSVNIMRDILRTLTTSLTVNNFYGGRVVPGKQYAKKDYLMSDYFSDWYQVKIESRPGRVGTTEDIAHVNRIDSVELRNNARDNDQSLVWRYFKKLDGEETGPHVFEEDFFERVIGVKWAPSGPTGGPSGPSGPTAPTGPAPKTFLAQWGAVTGPGFLGLSPLSHILEVMAWYKGEYPLEFFYIIIGPAKASYTITGVPLNWTCLNPIFNSTYAMGYDFGAIFVWVPRTAEGDTSFAGIGIS